MGDNYYNQQYPQGANQRDQYPQNVYAQQQPPYNTYQSPMDEGYRGSPAPQNLQVAQYDDRHRRSGEYGSRPRSRHGESYYDDDRYSDRGHYLPPPSPNSRRPSSRGSHREKEHDHRKSEAKSIGATILGGVAGALIGRKAGHKDILPTVLGGVAGAWGGHKLEEEFTERQGKGRDRKLEDEISHDGRRRGSRGRERSRSRSRESVESDRKSFREKVKDRIRSLSRKRTDDRERSRSSNRRRRDDSADSYESRPRERRSSGRYESEGRDRYERDGRHDRDRDYY